MGSALVSPTPGRRSLPFEPAARVLYDNYADQFAAEVLLSANESAIGQHRVTILVEHVQSAREAVYLRHRPRVRREIALLLGAAMLGAGGENALSEMLAGRFGLAFWFYISLGVVGFSIAAIGIRFL
jgi:hypothetical protein